MVAVATYPYAVGGVAVPGPYPVDGWGGCLVFVALGVARGIGRVYSSPMGTNNTFATGQTVTARMAGDHNDITVFTVVSRTAKFVKLEYNGNECAMPFGSYSMAPVVRA